MPLFLHAIPLEVRFKPEGDVWVGICDTLDIASQGDISRYFAATSGYMEKAAHKVLGND